MTAHSATDQISQWLDEPDKADRPFFTPWRLFFIAMCLIAAFVGGSIALADEAKAGGVGNYWTKKTCWYGDRYFTVTNYDSNTYTTQTYHHGSNVTPSYVLYDDESWPITTSEIWDAMSAWGTKKDGYQKFDTTSTDHTILVIWPGPTGTKCSVRL